MNAAEMHYTVVSQSADDVQQSDSAPALSMARYLVRREQMGLVPQLSIYAERGTSREQLRLLYMNGLALSVWKDMGMKPHEVGTMHRPSRTSVLVFGMPYSD